MDFTAVKNTLSDLKGLLNQLSDKQYALPISYLGDSSIGQHTRHIIELFECLLKSYESGLLNYDDRKRNRRLELETAFAIEFIDLITASIDKENKKLSLEQSISGSFILLESNYFREILYNLEHCIHHQALIKVAIHQMENITVNDNFGVAPSTIEFRKQCAQ
ncbi:DinB family protein [Flavobacterium sp.]|uniref:DinB family protein n=1 Tax=Flavobacterium sp. TaxID=239 RepID=UPI002605A09C|nr:DinB family protein [Flavobacterium sp.]